MSELEVSEAASPDCMHDSLRYSLPVKLSKFVDKVNVGQHDRSTGASSERVLVVVNWHPGACCQSLLHERAARFHLVSITIVFIIKILIYGRIQYSLVRIFNTNLVYT